MFHSQLNQSFQEFTQGWRDGSQWLRAITALREDQSPVPNPSRLQVAHSNSRGSDILFWAPITLHTDIVHMSVHK